MGEAGGEGGGEIGVKCGGSEGRWWEGGGGCEMGESARRDGDVREISRGIIRSAFQHNPRELQTSSGGFPAAEANAAQNHNCGD